MKTVYYETTASTETCHFDLTVEVVGPNAANSQCSVKMFVDVTDKHTLPVHSQSHR